MPLYFAYGSNISTTLMRRHAPSAVPLGVAVRPQWRFIIGHCGYGSIEEAPGHTLRGVVWRISLRDLAGLDIYENVASGLYYRRDMRVVLESGAVRAQTYFLRKKGKGRPRPGYIATILHAGREWSLPLGYLREISRWNAHA